VISSSLYLAVSYKFREQGRAADLRVSLRAVRCCAVQPDPSRLKFQ
jgi:hypothetical protein